MTEKTIETGKTDAPIIAENSVREAEKLAAVQFTETERRQALEVLPDILMKYERRREVVLHNHDGIGLSFNPFLHAHARPNERLTTVKIRKTKSPRWNFIRNDTEYIAFAPIWVLSNWIRKRLISSRELTEIYISRMKKYNPKLACVITITEERALQAADRADRELKAGRYRGPLHGIPWGVKDLFDTAGIKTTWGANPYRMRIPEEDAAIIKRLDAAGAVLAAKLSLGALAYGDVWFGGRTKNPWCLTEGSSGSSAGSAAATSAGLVAFSIGTETYGSIVSPCMTCGVTGLRSTYGRVPRTGAMTLSWTFDKIGPIARCVEDAATVFAYIIGADPGDTDSYDASFAFDSGGSVEGLRIGYDPEWFEEPGTRDIDRQVLELLRSMGAKLVEVSLPDLPYDALSLLVDVEASAAFEELTLTDRDDLLVRQGKDSWPNIFRSSRFIPAVEYIQIQRLRRKVMEVMAAVYTRVDVLVSPSFAGDLLLITNATGHPSLTIPAGFTDQGKPHGITLWGNLLGEGTLCNLGIVLERKLGIWNRFPPFS